MSHWIDVHVHLDKLENSVETTLDSARAVGVDRVITIGTDPQDLPVVLSLAEKYSPYVYCTLGIHPHEGSLYSTEVGEFILKNANHPRVLAVGEIGLDYYYNHSDREFQKSAFRAQLEIARQVNLPVEIHTRDAEEDTIAILSEFKGQVGGLIHCFTGTQWLAKHALDLGFNISISGVVTFKNADSLRETVKFIPIDRLHVETDAPFLSPVPMRGKQNTSAYVLHTAKVVADLKGLTLEELRHHTWQNARSLFSKLS